MMTRLFFVGWFLCCRLSLPTPVEAGQAFPAFPPSRLVFLEGQGDGFTFDTGEIQGSLRAEGKSIGLTSVVQLPSGVRIERGQGLLSPYRVFSKGKRYGTALWDQKSAARLNPRGAVEVYWEATSDRPFELWATYQITRHSEVELTMAVRAQTSLPDFEVFVASYFDESFTNAAVYAAGGPEADSAAKFVSAERAEGEWQLFPRDQEMTGLVQDGRWALPPNPVDWTIRSPYEVPVGARHQGSRGEVLALLYAPATECFAVSAPYQEESHTSLYFSLFGRTLEAGETGVARVRMKLLKVSMQAIEGLVPRLVQSFPPLP